MGRQSRTEDLKTSFFFEIEKRKADFEKRIKMSSCARKETPKTLKSVDVNTQEAKSLLMEGGSDVFTSNRHTLHNNEAKSFRQNFNLMKFRTQDDAPFFHSSPSSSAYVSATIPVENEKSCERVSALMLRSNLQWIKHAAGLTAAGLLVFGGIKYLKSEKTRPIV